MPFNGIKGNEITLNNAAIKYTILKLSNSEEVRP